jgi:peroxiredoxin
MGLSMRERLSLLFLVASLLFSLLPACKNSPTNPEPPGSLIFKGTIAAGGQKLSNVTVYLSWDYSKSTLTNANGIFQFSGFSGINFIITPSLKGYAFSPSNYTLAAQPRNDLNFAAMPATFGSMLGDIAADFSAKNQSGSNVSLYKYFGKVILLDFSADWCGPCRDEASHAESLYQEYKDRGFQVITILTSGSPADWAGEYSLTFPVLDDNSWKLWDIYGEDYIPLNIILDRNMTIRYKESGYDESTIANTIEKYL